MVEVTDYKYRALKNLKDTIQYVLLAVVVSMICFVPEALTNVPLLSYVVSVYSDLTIWAFVEALVVIGIVALAIISALLTRNNYQQFKIQQRIDAIDNEMRT